MIEKYAIIAEFRMVKAIWDKAKDKEGIKGVNFELIYHVVPNFWSPLKRRVPGSPAPEGPRGEESVIPSADSALFE